MSTVKLSQSTQRILSNFATINASIRFKKGNVIKTVSNAENILAQYECEEFWPQDFAIYDLSQFLGAVQTMTLNDQPTLEFLNDDYVVIRSASGSSHIRYYYSDPEITLKAAPETDLNLPTSSIQFDLPWDTLYQMMQCSGNLGLQDIKFISDGNDSFINMCDAENDTSNSAKFIPPNNECDGDHELKMKMENLLIYKKNASYRVRISDQFISEWVVTHCVMPDGSTNPNLKYYVALEPNA